MLDDVLYQNQEEQVKMRSAHGDKAGIERAGGEIKAVRGSPGEQARQIGEAAGTARRAEEQDEDPHAEGKDGRTQTDRARRQTRGARARSAHGVAGRTRGVTGTRPDSASSERIWS